MATVSDSDLKNYSNEITNISGDVAEVGVDRGETFKRLVTLFHPQNRMCYAFDSFYGMNHPGPYDNEQYGFGKFTNNGASNFIARLEGQGVSGNKFQCVEGYIPECFDKFDQAHPDKKFAIALIDVDHYQPTVDSLNWLWPKLNNGGILMLDDYFKGRRDIHATRAIHEWMETHNQYEIISVPKGQIHLRKI